MTESAKIFCAFLRRDCYVYGKKLKNYLFNYGFLYPLMYASVFGYLQPRILFPDNPVAKGTLLFSANILLIIFIMSFDLGIRLLFDLENNRYIDYQTTRLSPKLVIIQQILFSACFTFLITLPFFPMAKLVMQNSFDTSNTSWFQLYVIIFLACVFCCTHHFLASCALSSSRKIVSFWMRFNTPMINFGGFWAPFMIIKKFSPTFGKLLLLNPVIYISEGLRQAIIGGNTFLPFWQCAGALIIFSIGAIALTCYFFKKRVDHI